MNLKQGIETLVRKLIARRLRKVQAYEDEKFVAEVSSMLTGEAATRQFSDEQKHYLLYRIQRALLPEFVIADFGRVILQDSEFRSIFERFSGENWSSYERKWNLKELLRLTHCVAGDYAECGVFRGGSAFFMCSSAQLYDRQVHLFDSFKGLSEPQDHENSHWTQGDLEVGEDEVQSNLAGFQNFTTYAGWIPERFHEVEDRIFSFVHVDVDLEQPTRDSIAFFYPRLSKGGVLLLDDHGSAMCPGARAAALDYFKNRGEQVLDIATGQGLVIKQQPLDATGASFSG